LMVFVEMGNQEVIKRARQQMRLVKVERVRLSRVR
jgi:hypothetical protein